MTVILLEQLLHLAELGVLRVTQPLEEHHFRCHDLRTVLPGAGDRGYTVSRITRADRVSGHEHTMPGTEQVKQIQGVYTASA